ncbi:5'-nucleotidase C-terminal domain-containing protein [Limibaculum sp. M0105]|uniref:5'-nucleotidase C-terminal domain-containing protein n=1 Tax=Thermohalobaculum xanthum TaxID=2753746 RepID=A0A8J7SIF1_9RHOB|nr:bifunctional metallophosphatase/5'-nucleotidase [Thermohalobaculum xanthum]MBK0400295.1 5'-nucleotidase C-terminal domain-containing protein [Thermohalobaculum xanthum]
MARPVLIATVLVLGAVAAPARADYSLTILHTNDFHSRVEPINKYDSACGEKDAAEGACFGGSARLVTAIRARRAALANSILVDGGDQFQGSLFYTTYKGRAAAELMNALGYEAMTVGNHEFDDGPEILRDFMAAVEFPVLLANADVSAEPALADVLHPSAVIEKAGQRIGLIGLTPADTAELAAPGPNVTFSDPIPALSAEVARLTADGIDKIIVLSHSGYRRDLEIAAAVPGVDVIVGGHSNTFLSNTSNKADGPYPTWVDGPDGTRVPVVQAYAYGKFLGELAVTWDDAGRVVSAEGEPILMDGQIAEDAPLKARIAELAMAFDEIRNKVVAETAAPIDGERDTCRAAECQMGNLVADAMLDRVKGQGIQIAIANGGGLRASIEAGPITMGEIMTVLPFQNTLSTFALTGADVIAALENGVSQVEDGAGRFPQVAGMRYSFQRSAPPGARIRTVELREGDAWVPLDPARTYGVVSNDYVRRGGDGYAVFAERAIDAYDYGPALDLVVAEFLIAGGPYQPYIDGRITPLD